MHPQSQEQPRKEICSAQPSRPLARVGFVYGLAVISADGFIARTPSETPQSWSSGDDFNYLQARLREGIGGCCIMGRTTHVLNPNRSLRQRVVFTTSIETETLADRYTLFINPMSVTVGELLQRCILHGQQGGSPVMLDPEQRPSLFVLGGTAIYDFFRKFVGYDRFDLSIERNVTLGQGLPLFSFDSDKDGRNQTGNHAVGSSLHLNSEDSYAAVLRNAGLANSTTQLSTDRGLTVLRYGQ